MKGSTSLRWCSNQGKYMKKDTAVLSNVVAVVPFRGMGDEKD